jgi:hypothetical protein
MSDYVQIVILCEDRQQEVFARQFLIGCGIHQRRIRVNICPRGRGSGEQYVRQEYARETRLYCSRSAYLTIGLVVMIDADVMSANERFDQLEGALVSAQQPRRRPDERIAIFVPKRNVETWICYLQGETVNEADVYPSLSREGDCRPLVQRLAHKPVYRLTHDVPPSLQAACAELRRIFPAKQCVLEGEA